MRIAIDTGHVPKAGSVGLQGFDEYIYCRDFGADLRKKLQKKGHIVTLHDKPNLSNNQEISAVIDEINELDPQPDLIVCLHTNWSENPEARGAQVFYGSEMGKLAAGCIAHHLVKVAPGRAMPTEKKKNIAMIRRTFSVCAYIELPFGSNAGDYLILTKKRDQLLDATARGVEDYATIIESQMNYNSEA